MAGCLALNLVDSSAIGRSFDAYIIELVSEAITGDKVRKALEERWEIVADHASDRGEALGSRFEPWKKPLTSLLFPSIPSVVRCIYGTTS